MASANENMPSRVGTGVIKFLLEAEPLAEVFSVRIDNIDGEDPGRIYGKIMVRSGSDRQPIYNREKQSYETISPGGTISLTGPTVRPIDAIDSFSIHVVLYDWDREIIRCLLNWSSYRDNNVYDKPLSQKVHGKYGDITVDYAVWANAVEATVDVMLVSDGEEDPAKVYGDLIACNTKSEDKHSVLFCCTKEGKGEMVDNVIRPGQLIPLLRSLVAVPLESSLKIKANLKQNHNASLFAEDSVIANDTAEFPVQLHGTSEKDIHGEVEGKKILLQVTWGRVSRAVVEVILIKGGGDFEEDPTKVYGQLIARNSDFENYERVLFSKKDGFVEEVRAGKIIPLLISALVVPWRTFLRVEAYLKHDNNNASLSTDTVIANGSAKFFTTVNGTEDICGEKGNKIRVKVTWL